MSLPPVLPCAHNASRPGAVPVLRQVPGRAGPRSPFAEAALRPHSVQPGHLDTHAGEGERVRAPAVLQSGVTQMVPGSGQPGRQHGGFSPFHSQCEAVVLSRTRNQNIKCGNTKINEIIVKIKLDVVTVF